MTQPRIAYQGRPGAYSELAARQLLKSDFTALPCDSFSAVLDAVLQGHASHGVLPVHNSIVGDITENRQLLATAPIDLRAKISLRISHALLAPPGTRLTDIRQVYSHPVALAQCGRFFTRYPGMAAVPANDTAGAVEWLMQLKNRHGMAALAGAHTAQYYGAEVLLQNLEDRPDNHTRFVLIAAKRQDKILCQKKQA